MKGQVRDGGEGDGGEGDEERARESYLLKGCAFKVGEEDK